MKYIEILSEVRENVKKIVFSFWRVESRQFGKKKFKPEMVII